jgi:integrase/recombinase XerD
MLKVMPNDDPRYFFWDGKIKIQSARQDYSEWMRMAFDAAGISRENTNGGMMLSHRLRDTFAVEFLKAGGRLEDLSILLGHSSLVTTERHYSAWVPERKERLRRIAEEMLAKQEPIGLERREIIQ